MMDDEMKDHLKIEDVADLDQFKVCYIDECVSVIGGGEMIFQLKHMGKLMERFTGQHHDDTDDDDHADDDYDHADHDNDTDDDIDDDYGRDNEKHDL